ncbi:uncharacterized protein LOC113097287 [Carassius auratus]|uniref:non-specific serine/threonine protein kinase n=2 Tax=Carassius auratus TaxID=7957 RepID=A0A6P6PAP1_CARAU|nr:uncharacterized protein LOC113097287 [Carassius auratus]
MIIIFWFILSPLGRELNDPDTVCALSSCNNDIHQSTVCAPSDSSVDFSPASFSATSSRTDNVPQATVCVASGCSNDVSKSTVCAASGCNSDVSNDNVPQCAACALLDISEDFTQATVWSVLANGDDVSQCADYALLDDRDDLPQATVCAASSCSNDVPQIRSKSSDDVSFFTAMSRLSDDVPPVSLHVTSDCKDDALQTSVRCEADLSVDVPQSPFHETLDCRVSVPQASACAAADCSVDAPQDPVCQTEDTVPPQSSQIQEDETAIVINSRRYEVKGHLGEGGFGTVYAATRLDDGLQVAVKFASIWDTKLISIDGYPEPLPLEVALQILANKGPRVQEIIQLLDWQVEPDYYFMVLERPMPCQSLYEYLKCYEGTIEEDVARVIMHQAIFAARTCCLRGVFHRDIKLENLLINPDTLQVKLIDFGCGAILTDAGYTSFAGTTEYCPPEYYMTDKYHGEPATVWSLGILLFVILFYKFPKRRDLQKMNGESWTKAGFSKECCDFIRCCLQIDPKQRIELDMLSLHDWFMITDKENNNSTIMDINSCRYVMGVQLGEGGFGTVHAATRLEDGQQVAIKLVSNSKTEFISIDGYSKPLPLEVALLLLTDEGPRVQEVIQLLDWRVEPDRYILVLERPMHFEELNWFLLQRIVTIEEDVARVIMHQAIFAARTCCLRGVFHRDIKLENLLINPDTLQVKLIDFGCGAILTDAGYTSFAGTREYCPPEYLTNGKYHGKPATVWSLGILMFVMLCGDFPKRRDLRKINSNTWSRDGLSKECCDFIRCCLQIDPKQRIELEKLSLHEWFTIADKKK